MEYMFKNEMWINVPDYEGLYQVSNYGRVKSVKRYRKSKNNSISVVEERILKPKQTKDGYLSVALCKDNKLKSHRVHRLVAICFLPNPNNYPVINHKDECKTNNNVDNLEWCSIQYNSIYSIHKLSKPIVYDGIIYSSIKECGRRLNVDPHTIRYHLKTKTKYKGHFLIIINVFYSHICLQEII